jgi:hypothetical protein
MNFIVFIYNIYQIRKIRKMLEKSILCTFIGKYGDKQDKMMIIGGK